MTSANVVDRLLNDVEGRRLGKCDALKLSSVPGDRLHIDPILGDARITKLQPHHIRAWHAEVSAGHLSHVSVAKVYRLLRSILATAVEDSRLDRNPCQIKHGGVEQSAERPIPTVEEVGKLSGALPRRYALVPWLAAGAGLRRGEIFGLTRRQISLDSSPLRIDQALQEINGVGVEFVEPKTVGGFRTIVMPPRLAALVGDHMVTYVASEPDALVFTNRHGRVVRSVVWRDAWTRARSATALETVRLHDLRHLAGTLNAQAGATIKESMEFLGHSSPRAAMRYQHAAAQRAAEIANRMDELL